MKTGLSLFYTPAPFQNFIALPILLMQRRMHTKLQASQISPNHLHFKMLGSSAVMRLQCHMWARLHLNVHPSSSFRIEGQSFHSSANISCSVKPTCHLNSFIPRPKTMYIHHSFIIVVVVGSLKYTKKVVFYSL